MPTGGKCVVVLVLSVVLLGPMVGCSRNNGSTDPVTVLVSDKVLPIGKLVAAAWDDGSIRPTTVPPDIAPDDAVRDVNDIRCLVPSRSIPQGTVLRRTMFVEPSALGLSKGLTLATDKPYTCP